MKMKCDYGSNSRLAVGKNSRHVVIAIDDDGKRASIALTPESMKRLARELLFVATQIEHDMADEGKEQ